MLLYYKDSLAEYEEHKMQVPTTAEGVWINVKSQSQTRFLPVCTDRQPISPSMTNLMLCLRRSGLHEKIIMGDLNSDLSLKSCEDAESHLGRRLLRILSSYGMKCVIKNRPEFLM